ncbi:MAG: radical SAM protein [Ardenticatenaceae bacterium]|nr:radical SAM protein [Ardenticatenaceae bacterium]
MVSRSILDRHRLNRLSRRLATRLLGDDVARGDGHCRLPPEWLVLGINNFCNLKCKMCDVGLGDSATVFWANLIGDHPQNMTLDMLNEILRQASAFRPRPQVGLAFTEPLIHHQILDFCRAIVERGFYCQITSNGTMLPRLAEQLVEVGVDELVISVDGPPAVHDRIRGKVGTFAKLYQGVESLNAARERLKRTHPKVRFSFTITDENYAHVLDFVQAVEPLRPAGINISQLNFISDEMAAAHNARYGGDLAVVRSNLGRMEPAAFETNIVWAELERVRAYAAERGPALPALAITPNVTEPRGLETYYREPPTFVGGRTCTDPWRLMMIKTDGTVIPAHGRCYNFPVGKITEQSLSAIWNSPRFIEFRRTLRAAGGTLPACSRCCGIIGKPVRET